MLCVSRALFSLSFCKSFRDNQPLSGLTVCYYNRTLETEAKLEGVSGQVTRHTRAATPSRGRWGRFARVAARHDRRLHARRVCAAHAQGRRHAQPPTTHARNARAACPEARARRLPTYSYRLASRVANFADVGAGGCEARHFPSGGQLVCHTQSCSSCPSYRTNRPPTAHGERQRESRCQTCAWARAGTAKSCRVRGRCRSSRGRSCSKISRRGSGDQRPPCRRHGLCRSGRRR